VNDCKYSLGAHIELNREPCVNQGRARRCYLALFIREGTFLATHATVSQDRNGKAVKKAGESEDLPKQTERLLKGFY